jgi:hypothetical protein
MDKCSVGLPFRQTDFNILFGFGVDDLSACIDWLKKHKLGDEVYGDTSVVKYNRKITAADKAEYNEELARVRAIVEQHYWRIEKTFLPTRTKY